MGAVASILLQLPFYKHIFAWLGGCEAGDSFYSHSSGWHLYAYASEVLHLRIVSPESIETACDIVLCPVNALS